jgi:hypothetical protein
MHDALVACLLFLLAALCLLCSICFELCVEDDLPADPRSSPPSRRGRPGIIIGSAGGVDFDEPAAAVPASGVDSDEPAAAVPASGAALDELAAGRV